MMVYQKTGINSRLTGKLEAISVFNGERAASAAFIRKSSDPKGVLPESGGDFCGSTRNLKTLAFFCFYTCKIRLVSNR